MMHAQEPTPAIRAASPDTPPNDRQAFAILAREHHRALLTYGRALTRNEATAADLVQESFITAWQNLTRFDVTRNFSAWMRGIIRNKWREHLRRHHREVDVDEATLEVWEQRLHAWEEGRQQGAELFEQLETCIKQLPSAMQEAVSSFYYNNEAGDSIATTLGIDASTLRKRLQRAREALRTCLQRKLQHQF